MGLLVAQYLNQYWPNRALRYAGVGATAPNVWYTDTNKMVYYTAAVCIVYDPLNHTQRFFLGHDDDIKVRTAMRKLRIVTLRFGTGRERMVLERWTNPKLSRRTCTCYNRGIGNRRASRNGLVSDLPPKSLNATIATFSSLLGATLDLPSEVCSGPCFGVPPAVARQFHLPPRLREDVSAARLLTASSSV
jgi:hypothetical protein